MTLSTILETHKSAVAAFEEGGEPSDELFYALYEHWLPEMPYGTAKARDGDPGEWIAERLASELQR